jgi:predicted CDP-diglyceride synthetase/phosphatidate cytidylyltransferase
MKELGINSWFLPIFLVVTNLAATIYVSVFFCALKSFMMYNEFLITCIHGENFRQVVNIYQIIHICNSIWNEHINKYIKNRAE